MILKSVNSAHSPFERHGRIRQQVRLREESKENLQEFGKSLAN